MQVFFSITKTYVTQEIFEAALQRMEAKKVHSQINNPDLRRLFLFFEGLAFLGGTLKRPFTNATLALWNLMCLPRTGRAW